MLVYRCQGFFALTVFGTFLAGPVKSSIGFSFFCCPRICSACPSAYLVVHQSAWISICSAGLPARCSACLLARLAMHLAMHLAIWLSCISILLHIWQSGNLAVHSSASARICLHLHLSAILSC